MFKEGPSVEYAIPLIVPVEIAFNVSVNATAEMKGPGVNGL